MLQPNSIIDALQQELWKAAMADEFSTLMRKKKNMVLSVSTKWKKSNWMQVGIQGQRKFLWDN